MRRLPLHEREHVEKLRSAQEASHSTDDLLVPNRITARYRAPAGTTVYPLEYAFHLLGDINGKTVLEYGCGDGLNTVVLANRGARILALDISAELLAVAKRRLELNRCDGVDLLLGSAHTLPLPDESVDIVFGMAILHHLDLKLASREVWRVLKKGGRGVFQEPIRNSKLVARFRDLFPKRADVSPFERPLTDEEIKAFAAECSYRAKTFHLLFSSVASLLPSGHSDRAARVSAAADAYLLDRFPSLAYYGTIKVLEIVKE